jgi:uncharacterized protein
MRRMPEARRLDVLLRSGAPVEGQVEAIARVMATFHDRQPPSPAADQSAGASTLARLWKANSESLRRFGSGIVDLAAVDSVEHLALRYLAGRAALFRARIAAGRARDGHGDLQADDVFCLDDGPRVLDCLEFDDRLRCGDVLGDVAFLAMDLERLGRPDLGALFLRTYRDHAGDSWPASLAHHHIAYRAQVRAKVAAIRAGQGSEDAIERARHLLDLTLEHLHAARVRLIVVGGLPGTGKSTVATGLAAELGATLLRSDQVRKERAGIPPTRAAAAPFGGGIYDAASTAATYNELLARGGRALAAGESVVLDASWHDPAWRARAEQVADAATADLVELRCSAPLDVARRRLLDRRLVGHDASDATAEVLAVMAETDVPWPTAADIDTTGDREDAVRRALSIVTASDEQRAAA